MKNYYIAKFRMIVNGQDHSIESVSGSNYNPNIVRGIAEDRVRKDNPGKTVTGVLIDKTDMDLEEFKTATGRTPTWFSGPEKTL